jgi:hypothetical protein
MGGFILFLQHREQGVTDTKSDGIVAPDEPPPYS